MTENRHEPRKHRSDFWLGVIFAALALIGFGALLVFSVTWRNPPAQPVSAEVYAPSEPTPPKPLPPEPKPPETPPPPPPPPPEVKPPLPDPQIELQKKKEAEKKAKEEARLKKLEEEKARKKKLEEEKARKEKAEREKKEREQKEQQERERQAAEAAENERKMQALIAQQALAEATNLWIDKIRAKIKGNITLPPNMEGNPEAIYKVKQLPTGEILDAQLVRSSGNKAYDDAVYRAILKSSPLPLPDRQGIFQRELELRFRPNE